jgi:hypothetical protein
MNIIKQSTGNVVLTDAAGNIQKVFVNVNALDVKGTDEVIVKFGFNQWHSLFASQIANTQVEPAAAVAFSGNAFDLVALLSTSFFFELSGGGGDDLATVLIAGNTAGANDINLNNNDLLNTDLIAFNLASNTNPSTAQVTYNSAYGTFLAGLGGGSVKLQIGTQEFAKVVNKTVPNVDLLASNYQVCVVAGATGQRLSVKLARADNDINSAGTLGIVAENINKNQEGFIQTTGTIENLNTSGSLQGETWADGDSLYLSGTTFGAITNVKPSAPIHEVRIGYVEYAHAVNGKIYVKIDNGYELDELHNVSITTPANGNFLEYNGSLWVNRGIVYTVELMDALTVDFYAPYDLKINTTTNIKNAPTITILDDGAAYSLTNTIAVGSKITVTASVAGVTNLNITKA